MVVHKATLNPEIYGPDKYKTDNDGSYRTFEKHHYRIAYRFSKSVYVFCECGIPAWNLLNINSYSLDL
jgi:hypothetical protein